jgi:GNAT superfamily N-acetyltransferase
VSAPPEQRWLEGLPEDVRLYARLAEAIAVQIVGGAVVAVCAAGDVTETLWDVGIDTLEGHRRRGHAAACFHALAAWMAGRGRQPVWSAYEDYPPSLTLAAKLGFQPVDRIAVLSPTSQATS